eukprot:8605275-Pyramimonas_sp.AAC.1
MTALATALERVARVKFAPSLAFQCESDPEKRRFLCHMFPGHTAPMFTDVCKLHRDVSRDDRTGFDCVVRSATFNTIGCSGQTTVPSGGGMRFPCQDASRMNPKASSSANRTSVASGTLRTGSVFDGLIRHYTSHPDGAHIGLAENVVGMQDPVPDSAVPLGFTGRVPTNLDVVVHRLQREA